MAWFYLYIGVLQVCYDDDDDDDELKPVSAHTHRYNLHYVTLHFYSQI